MPWSKFIGMSLPDSSFKTLAEIHFILCGAEYIMVSPAKIKARVGVRWERQARVCCEVAAVLLVVLVQVGSECLLGGLVAAEVSKSHHFVS